MVFRHGQGIALPSTEIFSRKAEPMDSDNKLVEQEILKITQQMLHAMYTGDPAVHQKHSTEDMSAFEWYIAPYRVDGLAFHLDLIAGGGNGSPSRLDMLTPRVQVHGDTAIVCYTLLKTMLFADRPAEFARINETRVFVKQDGVWKMAHLHKSPAA